MALFSGLYKKRKNVEKIQAAQTPVQQSAPALSTTQGTGKRFFKTAPKVTANNFFTTNRKGVLGGWNARRC